MDSDDKWTDLIMKADLWENDMTKCEISGIPLLIVNTEGEISVYDDRCPHQESSLYDNGDFNPDEKILTCMSHMWEFNSLTGESINPEGEKLTKLQSRVHNGTIQVKKSSDD